MGQNVLTVTFYVLYEDGTWDVKDFDIPTDEIEAGSDEAACDYSITQWAWENLTPLTKYRKVERFKICTYDILLEE